MVFDRLVGWDRVAQLLAPDVMTMLDARYVNHTGNQTMTGQLLLTGSAPQIQTAPSAAGPGIMALQSSGPGQFAQYVLSSGGSGRWAIVKDGVAEAVGDVGSDFAIQRMNNAGAAIDNPLMIQRSTGLVTLTAGLQTMGGNLLVDRTGAIATVILESDPGQFSEFAMRSSGGNYRWVIRKNNTAESGGNAGSNFEIARFADGGGAPIDIPLTIFRSTGQAAFAVSPSAPGYVVGGLTVVNSRKTGWGTPTTTVNRAAVTNSTTLANLAQHVGTLIADLMAHGLIGN